MQVKLEEHLIEKNHFMRKNRGGSSGQELSRKLYSKAKDLCSSQKLSEKERKKKFLINPSMIPSSRSFVIYNFHFHIKAES